MDDILLKALESTPSVILALIIFYFYRQDRKDSIEAYRGLTERFDALGGDFKELVKENTKATVELASAINKLR